jgi:molybdenum cofactor cytidylyltransferase
MDHFAVVILSAGLSSRMGVCKPLLALNGTTALIRVISLYRKARVRKIIVVTGHEGGKIAAEATGAGAEVVSNPDYKAGMFSSVCSGISALGKDISGFFIHPVDIPLVRLWTVQRVKAVFLENRPAVVYPVFKEKRGHPPLIATELIPAILDYCGTGGLRGALTKFDPDGMEAKTFDSHILLDMDTPEDYLTILKRFAKLGIPDPEEARELMGGLNIKPQVVRHGQAVAKAATEIARELKPRIPRLNLDLIYAAALLHDIAKGRSGHEREGGRILKGMGLPEVADIVAAHRDVPPPSMDNITEKEIVYFADKLVKGGERVSLEQRFQEKLDIFSCDPPACAAIHRRRNNALAMRALFLGMSSGLAQLL